MISIKRGTHMLIRVDGTNEIREGNPTNEQCRLLLRAHNVEHVVLTRAKGRPHTIMIIDEAGMHYRLPINEIATALAREAFALRPPYAIHGDVIVANDRDAAE